MKTTVYEMVTERIIEMLQKGVVPWQKTWTGGANGQAPKNLISKKAYRGVNVWLLGSLGYEHPYFLSYKQATDLGGNVKKGEKGYIVVFWNWLDSKTETMAGGKPKKIPFLRYFTVFNVAQCEGISFPIPAAKTEEEKKSFNPIPVCEKIVANMPKKPDIRHGEQRAFYSPAMDFVNMPKPETFTNEQAYYSTLFHELAHSTGHASRLSREGITSPTGFGSNKYSKEELVAEMSAAFLCSVAEISCNDTMENSAAYLQNWISALKGDCKLVVSASGQAQKAADFILNIQPEIESPKE